MLTVLPGFEMAPKRGVLLIWLTLNSVCSFHSFCNGSVGWEGKKVVLLKPSGFDKLTRDCTSVASIKELKQSVQQI